MKLSPVIAAAFLSLVASGASASEFDLGNEQADGLAVEQSNPAVVAIYRAELLASVEGTLKEGLMQRFAAIGLSIDEQAARIRQLVAAGSLSPRNLAVLPDFDTR